MGYTEGVLLLCRITAKYDFSGMIFYLTIIISSKHYKLHNNMFPVFIIEKYLRFTL